MKQTGANKRLDVLDRIDATVTRDMCRTLIEYGNCYKLPNSTFQERLLNSVMN